MTISESFRRVPGDRSEALNMLAVLREYSGKSPGALVPDPVLVRLRDERISYLRGYLDAPAQARNFEDPLPSRPNWVPEPTRIA